MRFRPIPLWAHYVALFGMVAAYLVLWMLPVNLSGFPYVLPGFIDEAKVFDIQGTVPMGNGRLSTLIVWFMHGVIRWENVVGWSAASAAVFAVGLLPWWESVRRLFDVRVAWFSTIVLGLLPMYWLEALRLSGYSFALFFLFTGFALFLIFLRWNRIVAGIVFAVCFGAALGSRDAFVAFIPWLVFAYIWCERRAGWRAITEAILFCIIAYTAYTAPLLFNVASTEGELTQRLTLLLPSLARSTPSAGHLYPDDYTYEFEKEAFDQRVLAQIEKASFLERQQNAKNLYLFGLRERTVLRSIGNSIWLLIHAFPPLLFEDTVGGAFLWLFVLPGAVAVYNRRKPFFILMIGLWISMEILLRFVLHFGRDHLMDVGWMLALFGGVGIVVTTQTLAGSWGRVSYATLSCVVITLVGFQLLQANRKQLARLYAHSEVPEAYAAEQVLTMLPNNAIIAHPRKYHLFAFSDRIHVDINRDTVDWLAEEGRLRQPFDHYGVTHIIGYEKEQADKIHAAVPDVRVIDFEKNIKGVPLTSFMKYLLHLVR